VLLNFLKNIWLRLPSLRAFVYRPRQDTYLFMPINGAGLGHLTRCLAIAKKLQEIQPQVKIVFLTTSIGITLVHRAGFACHHVTPAALLDVGSITWNKLFYRTVQNVLSVHRPGTLVFDGTIPYLGLQRTMRAYGRISYIWIKRGLYKEGVNSKRLNSFLDGFDKVIAPGELADDDFKVSLGANNVYAVNPISLLDKKDLLSRERARKELRLNSGATCAYVQLGAGNINGISDLQERLISNMQARGIQVVLGQSPISLHPEPNINADSVIVDYPNSKYFAAFDFAVLAGGYNSVCEAITLGLPAIFYPNTNTGADDQVERVMQACTLGPYRYLLEADEQKFALEVDFLLGGMAGTALYQKINGAVEAARMIVRRHANEPLE